MGQDFHPDYVRLGDLVAELGDVPTVAMTATAAQRVREDIVTRLRMTDPTLVVTGFARPNLTLYVVRATESPDQQAAVLEAVAAGGDGPCGRCDTCRAGTARPPVRDDGAAHPVRSAVEHDEFGRGVVTDLEEDRLTVLFDEVGHRTLSLEVVEEQRLLRLV